MDLYIVSHTICVMSVMNPSSTNVQDIEVLAKCPSFDLIKFKYGVQTHYQVMPRRLNGILAIVIRDDDKWVMIKQSRPFFDKPLLEFVMGGPNKRESLEAAVAREVKEETGYEPLSVEPLLVLSPLPSAAVHNHHCYIVKVGNTPSHPPTEPDQPDAKVVILSISEILEALKKGEVISYAYPPLLHFLINKGLLTLLPPGDK